MADGELAANQRKVTELVSGLARSTSDRRAIADELFREVYGDLRRLARRFMRQERVGHTLQPTALVNEAYVRMVDQRRVDWRGRSHFFSVGARVMRRLLVDHARRRGAIKRAGDRRRVTLRESLNPNGRRMELALEDVLSLDAALSKLSELDERAARVVELRFFGGLDMTEVAEVVGVSKRTSEGDWAHARAWLRRELSSGVSSHER